MQALTRTLVKSSANVTSASSVCSRLASSTVRKTMQSHKIVPDVIPDAPVQLANVNYFNTVVTMGKRITPQEARSPPCVKWPHKSDRLYSLIMLDPDSPSHCQNFDSEWHHWFVGNIPGKTNPFNKMVSVAGSIPAKPVNFYKAESLREVRLSRCSRVISCWHVKRTPAACWVRSRQN